MKKVILSAAVAVTAAMSASAQNGMWRDFEDPWARKNSIAVSLSATGFFGNEARSFGSVGVEYERIVYRNLGIGATALYAPICTPGNTVGSYPKTGTFWFAGAKIDYHMRVVRNLLYFRVGAGTGIGVQHRPETAEIRVAMRDDGLPPTLDTRIYPHLIVDACWILRVSRNFDIRIAPLIFSPSQYIFGAQLHRSGGAFFEHANMFTLGAATRF